MDNLLGQLKAQLIEQELSISKNLVEKINENINPPEKVSENEVYIRAMYIVSDQLNSHGGSFRADEQERLTQLLIDSPVMVGHRKDALPIARNFFAETVDRNGEKWVKVYFYWLRDALRGEDLRKNIDGGIYKECSISFIFSRPECSICGKDIRECGHRPFGEYIIDGKNQTASFYYCEIIKALETSLVYRGSVSNTSITKKLMFGYPQSKNPEDAKFQKTTSVVERIWSAEKLSGEHEYLVMPAYESIPVVISQSDGKTIAFDAGSSRINHKLLEACLDKIKAPVLGQSVEGRIIGYRGKERLPVSELVSLFAGEKSRVKRVELKTLPDSQFESNCAIRHLKIGGDSLAAAISKFTTRLGVEIIDLTALKRYQLTNQKLAPLYIVNITPVGNQFRYDALAMVPDDNKMVSVKFVSNRLINEFDLAEVEMAAVNQTGEKISFVRPRIQDAYPAMYSSLVSCGIGYSPKESSESLATISQNADGGIYLSIETRNKRNRYYILNWDLNLFKGGRRFLAETVESAAPSDSKPILRYEIAQSEKNGKSTRLSIRNSRNKLALRPAKINGQELTLVYLTEVNRDD